MVNSGRLTNRESMGAIMQLTLTRQFAWQPAESMKPIAAVLLVTSVGVTAIPRPAEHFKWHAQQPVPPAVDIAPYPVPRLQAAALLTQPVIPMTDPFTPGAKPLTSGVRFTEPRPAPLALKPVSIAKSSAIALMPARAIPHQAPPPMKGTASPAAPIEEPSPPVQFAPGGETLTPLPPLSASNPLLPPTASQDQAGGTNLVAPEIKAPSDFELNVPGTRPRLQPIPMLDPETRIELARKYADDAGAPIPAPAGQPLPSLGITAPALSDTPAVLTQPLQPATSHITKRRTIEGETASRSASPAPLQVVSREIPRISRIEPSPTPRTISREPMPDKARSSGTSHYVRTSQGLTFEVSAQVNGTSIGRLPLLIADGENISVRLADLLAAVAPMMPSHVHDRLSTSQAAQDYMTFNDLRAAGISVRFDSSDRLILGVR